MKGIYKKKCTYPTGYKIGLNTFLYSCKYVFRIVGNNFEITFPLAEKNTFFLMYFCDNSIYVEYFFYTRPYS